VFGYHDPSIGFGLLGSTLSLAALLGAGLFLRRRRRVGDGADPPETSSC
jgi:hypothetical protein